MPRRGAFRPDGRSPSQVPAAVDENSRGLQFGELMLYDAYEMQRSLLAGASTLANFGAGWLQNPANPMAYSSMGPIVASALDVFAHASAPRGKPEFGLDTVMIEGKSVRVREEIALRKAVGQLKHFA